MSLGVKNFIYMCCLHLYSGKPANILCLKICTNHVKESNQPLKIVWLPHLHKSHYITLLKHPLFVQWTPKIWQLEARKAEQETQLSEHPTIFLDNQQGRLKKTTTLWQFYIFILTFIYLCSLNDCMPRVGHPW